MQRHRNFAARESSLWKKKNAHGKKYIGYGKRDIPTAKENIFSVKRKEVTKENGSLHSNRKFGRWCKVNPLQSKASHVQIKNKEQAKAYKKPS